MSEISDLNAGNPYLQGHFTPVASEGEHRKLEVIGEVPRDFAGVYARNGPNPAFEPRGRYHWFDGDGMIHAVHIEDGEVTYRNRYVQTKGLATDREAHEAVWTGLMESTRDNPKGIPYKDTANTDLDFHNGELLALWYICGTPYRVDPLTLETLGPTDFGSGRPMRISAHTKSDPHSSELMFFDYGPVRPYMTYGVLGPEGKITHHTEIDLEGPRLPHDMAITERYSILMDLPVFPNPEARDKWSIEFHRDRPARFGVLPRHAEGSEIRWFEAEPCYIYHTVNAWEEDGAIVMIGCRTADPVPPPRAEDGKWGQMMANLRIDAQFHEWRFDLETGKCTERHLDDRRAEFPMINAEELGKKTRYSYHQALADTPALLFDGIVKYDHQSGSSTVFDYGPGRFGSEAPFAPKEGAADEDDGYLVSFVHDLEAKRSELVIIDAKAVADGPVARVMLPTRVPAGFHGVWVPQARLGATS